MADEGTCMAVPKLEIVTEAKKPPEKGGFKVAAPYLSAGFLTAQRSSPKCPSWRYRPWSPRRFQGSE
jgi:hypothetical protein